MDINTCIADLAIRGGSHGKLCTYKFQTSTILAWWCRWHSTNNMVFGQARSKMYSCLIFNEKHHCQMIIIYTHTYTKSIGGNWKFQITINAKKTSIKVQIFLGICIQQTNERNIYILQKKWHITPINIFFAN